VERVIDAVLKSRKYPEQAYKVCMGILNLGKKYGNERFIQACVKANELGMCSLNRIESWIKEKLEKERHPQLDLEVCIPQHCNIRGSGYYNLK